jgi:hypothetical protein
MISVPIQLIAAVAQGCEKTFFGLVPWYHYLNVSGPPECEVSFNLLPKGGRASDVPLVMVAIVDDLLRIAGIIALAMVIVGATQFITSQGNPEDRAKAQSTVINALIGMAVAIVAVAFVSFIGNKVGR